MIRAEQISLKLSDRFSIWAPELSIANHEITALIGTNGSGKTTLSKILSGQLKCSEGKVTYHSEHLKAFNSRELSFIRAVMPQHTNCHLDLTVREVLEIGLFNQMLPSKEIKDTCRLASRKHGIEHLLNSKFNRLSGGEKQKCLLVQCLLQLNNSDYSKSFLFLDEPMNNLDLLQEKLLIQNILELKDQGLGILIILHDLNQVAQLADQILFMKNGVLDTSGSPQDVLSEQFILREYGLIAENLTSPVTQQTSIHLHLPN